MPELPRQVELRLGACRRDSSLCELEGTLPSNAELASGHRMRSADAQDVIDGENDDACLQSASQASRRLR